MRTVIMNAALILALSVFSLCTIGCPENGTDNSRVIDMEPMYFTVLQSGDRVEIKDYDSVTLFEEAERHFRAGRFTDAKRLYSMAANESPEASTRGLAWFNIALCEIGLEKPGAGLEALEKARQALGPEADSEQIAVVEVQALASVGQWEEVLRVGEPLLSRDLAPLWKGRVLLNVGQARFLNNDLLSAQEDFRTAHDVIVSSIPIPEHEANALLASAYFRMAQIPETLFRRIKFKLPVERMGIDMVDKVTLLYAAEGLFRSAVRIRDHKCAAQAGYRLGQLYETMAEDLLQGEIPPDFEPEDLQVYHEEMNQRVVPFLQRAMTIYQKNAEMIERFGLSTEYLTPSRERFEQVGRIIESLRRNEPSPPGV